MAYIVHEERNPKLANGERSGVMRLHLSDGTTAEHALADWDANKDAIRAQHDPMPIPVPEEADSVALKTALWQTPYGESNLLEAAEAVVAEQPVPVQLFWSRHKFRRDDPTLNALATQHFGLTSEQIDDIFRAASAITAAG